MTRGFKRGASEVAGQRVRLSVRTDDVASFRNAKGRNAAGTGRDRVLMAEFDDFMRADDELASDVMPQPSPVFRERLRQRLWRAHVITHVAPSGRELH